MMKKMSTAITTAATAMATTTITTTAMMTTAAAITIMTTAIMTTAAMTTTSKKVQWGTYWYPVSVEPEIFTCTRSPYRQGCTDSGKP